MLDILKYDNDIRRGIFYSDEKIAKSSEIIISRAP